MGVLLLDPGQLDHDDDENHQAQSKNQEKIGHHAHIEGDIIAQPTATGRQIKTQTSLFTTTTKFMFIFKGKNHACYLLGAADTFLGAQAGWQGVTGCFSINGYCSVLCVFMAFPGDC